MVRLRSRCNCPPGGFLFFQAETGWESAKAVPSSQWDFFLLCRSLQAHRKQNPRFNLSTDMGQIEAEVDLANALRVKAIPNTATYLVEDGGGITAPLPKSLRPLPKLAAVVGAAKKYIAGGQLFFDWIGEGGVPVDPVLSEHRAEICATCPQNKAGDWKQFFTAPVAGQIQRQIEQRNDLKLSTPYDAQLGTCQACLCVLSLKVHVPIKHIAERMPATVKRDLDPRCWVLKEIA